MSDKKIKITKKCLTCQQEKQIVNFYKSKSAFNQDGLVPYCKECLNKIDILNIDNFIDILRKIDVPYIKNTWNNILKKYDTNQLGQYLKIVAMQQKDRTFKDSDKIGLEEIERLDKKIEQKENKIEKLDDKIENKETQFENLREVYNEEKNKQKSLNMDDLRTKWGSGFSAQNYIDFESKWNALYDTLPNKTELHLEPFKKYIIYCVKEMEAIASNNPSEAKTWG